MSNNSMSFNVVAPPDDGHGHIMCINCDQDNDLMVARIAPLGSTGYDIYAKRLYGESTFGAASKRDNFSLKNTSFTPILSLCDALDKFPVPEGHRVLTHIVAFGQCGEIGYHRIRALPEKPDSIPKYADDGYFIFDPARKDTFKLPEQYELLDIVQDGSLIVQEGKLREVIHWIQETSSWQTQQFQINGAPSHYHSGNPEGFHTEICGDVMRAIRGEPSAYYARSNKCLPVRLEGCASVHGVSDELVFGVEAIKVDDSKVGVRSSYWHKSHQGVICPPNEYVAQGQMAIPIAAAPYWGIDRLGHYIIGHLHVPKVSISSGERSFIQLDIPLFWDADDDAIGRGSILTAQSLRRLPGCDIAASVSQVTSGGIILAETNKELSVLLVPDSANGRH